MISSPYILTKLPESLTGDKGQVHVCDIHAVNGSKKRKRSELAVAVDNEGINLYDVYLHELIDTIPESSSTCRFDPPS